VYDVTFTFFIAGNLTYPSATTAKSHVPVNFGVETRIVFDFGVNFNLQYRTREQHVRHNSAYE